MSDSASASPIQRGKRQSLKAPTPRANNGSWNPKSPRVTETKDAKSLAGRVLESKFVKSRSAAGTPGPRDSDESFSPRNKKPSLPRFSGRASVSALKNTPGSVGSSPGGSPGSSPRRSSVVQDVGSGGSLGSSPRRSTIAQEVGSGSSTPRAPPVVSEPRASEGSSTARAAPSERDGCIQVCIRCRPMNSKEDKEGSKNVWGCKAQTVTELADDGRTATGKTWSFDNVFGPSVTTSQLFDSQCKPIVQSALDGYNGTVFAYGQTSSGKTFTLMGNPEKYPGVVVLTIDEIFSWISSNAHMEWDTYASYIEIYNESITDLLQRDTRKSKNLKIIEDKSLGPTVKDLKEVPVINRQNCLDLIVDGEKRRTYAATNMNETSSRSHTIFRLRIEGRQGGGANHKEHTSDIMGSVASEFLSMQNKLEADHASLYLVDQSTNELFIQAGEITLRLPMSQGIAGAVATTGETINIADAYQDDRFNASVDKKTGYRTKSILCMPIRGLDRQIVGVVQLINKMAAGSDGFNANDELQVLGLTQRLGPLITTAQRNVTMSIRSQLNLVDLAGSERASKSGASGDVLKQAGYINQSLHSLGACIAILSEGKKQHVPFRDSKLTQMLSSSLGGNAKTCLICAISPANSNRSETHSTLGFASRAKKIVNNVKRNCQRDQTELAQAYEDEIARLKAQLQATQQRRSSFTSIDQEAIYKLQSNQLAEEVSTASKGFRDRLSKFEADVAEAQTLSNQSVADQAKQILLRAMIATERGQKEDPDLVVRVTCSVDTTQEEDDSPNTTPSTKWVSEEELYKRLEWLRKQNLAGMLDSFFTNGSNAWESTETAIESAPARLPPGPRVPQVSIDWLRRFREVNIASDTIEEETLSDTDPSAPPKPQADLYRRSFRSTWPRPRRSLS